MIPALSDTLAPRGADSVQLAVRAK